MRESMITATDRWALSNRTAYGMVREAYLKIIFSLVYSYIYGRSPIEYRKYMNNPAFRTAKLSMNELIVVAFFEKGQTGKLLWQLTPMVKRQYFVANAMRFVGDGDCKSNSPYQPAHSHFLHSAQKQHGSGRENNWVYKAERAMQLWR